MEFEQGALDDPPDEGTLPGEGDGGIYKGRFGSRTYTYTEPSNSYPQNRDMVSALSVLFSEILLLAADYGLPESAVERLLDIIANLKPDLHPDFARNIPDNFRAMHEFGIKYSEVRVTFIEVYSREAIIAEYMTVGFITCQVPDSWL